ncbi:ImmA/IrrE family metallo-endopeptidase [Crateriforma spongiae]|uniref:ImmA/IrrE family metallo-endopeptidase n=1 Tax=Crateriforma spongiae TaxID=2724528 RepID=UPI0039B0B797
MALSTATDAQTLRRDLPVPPLTMRQIAAEADAVLLQYAERFDVAIEAPIEIEDIVGSLMGLRIEFERLEEALGEGVLGALFMRDRRISIDESLDPEIYPDMRWRYHFTLGHELGHWVLHRAFVLSPAIQKLLFGDESLPEIVCRSHGSRPRIERQADQFAGCLLMPEWLLRPAWRRWLGHDDAVCDAEVCESVGDVDLSRFADLLGGDRKLSEMRVRREMFCLPLAKQFAVSDEAMRIQLEQLGLFVARHQPRLF